MADGQSGRRKTVTVTDPHGKKLEPGQGDGDEDGRRSPRIDRKMSVSMDRRAKRATAVTFFMKSIVGDMLTGLIDEGVTDKTFAAGLTDAEGVRKPVVVEFLEKAILAVLRKSTMKRTLSSMSLASTSNDVLEKSADGQSAKDDASDADSDDEKKSEKSGNSDDDSEGVHSTLTLATQAEIGILQSLQDNLMSGTNVAKLAGLLSTSTFALKDKRVEALIGPSVPFRIREALMLELSKAIDTLWERFGVLLVEEHGSFEKSFAELDGDGSGFIDREEFTAAYVDIHMRAMKTEHDRADEDADAECHTFHAFEQADEDEAGDDRKLMRRMSTVAGHGMSSHKSIKDRRQSYAASSSRNTISLSHQHVAKMNRLILKADAEFLFDMLRTGERGMAKIGDDDEETELEVSMRSLVLRLAGLGEKAMESLRLKIIDRFVNLENAFRQYTMGEATEMTCQEFENMYRDLAVGDSIASKKVHFTGTADADKEHRERAKRIFNGIDLDGSGEVTISECHRALANYAPPTNFGVFRRRILLHYGSYEAFFAEVSNGSVSRTTEEIVESFTYEHDLNCEDGRSFAERLGLAQDHGDGQDPPPFIVPDEGYSVEEFAIQIFLNKSDDATPDELIKNLGYTDREKDIPFREFSDKVVACGEGRARQGSWMIQRKSGSVSVDASSKVGGVAAKTRAVAKAALTTAKLGAPGKKISPPNLSHRPSTFQPTSLPVTCKLTECRTVYEALQREHQRINVNILMRSLTNFSDVIALDKKTYQSGDRIICRVRLSNNALKRCKDMPVLAVVPEKLEWKEQGIKSFWSLNGDKITDFQTICERVHELPRNSNGVTKEACLKIPVPFVLATEERYEVRVFASANGREPGRQVGRGVAVDILMPRPQTPLVDQVSLNAATGEASVVLHWSPPPGKFIASPILNYVLQVEPLIYRHELIAENFTDADKDEDDDDDVPGSSTSDTSSEDIEIQGLQEVVVWSPASKAFTKKLSYRINSLQRGVQYRFGVQCVHAGQGRHTTEGKSQVRGAPSELSNVVSMPVYNVTEAPGEPQPSQRENGLVDLTWSAPADEGLFDSNRIFTYVVQYRHAFPKEGSDSDSDSKSSGNSKPEMQDSQTTEDENKAQDEEVDSDEEEGWVTIDETTIFISQPRFVDFYGWQVPCLIHDLEPIDGRHDTRPHEFRVCAVNYAGSSPWSATSAPITLHIVKEKPKPPPPPSNLEVVEVHGHKRIGEMASLRSQCILRWIRPMPSNSRDLSKFSIQVRDASQANGEWKPVDAYLTEPRPESNERRCSTGPMIVQAIVNGLEQFPDVSELSVQVQSTNSIGGSTAEVIIPGVEKPEPVAPPEAPVAIQMLTAQAGPKVVELQWRAVDMPDTESTKPPPYVLQAAYSPKPVGHAVKILVEDLMWTDFETVEDVCIANPGSDGLVTCFARGLGAEGLYIFKVGVANEDGELVCFSPTSEAPFEMMEKLAERNAARTSTVTSKSEHVKPKKARDVQVVQSEQGWCQLTWEQRVGVDGDIPTTYEVEECKEDTTGNMGPWVPTQATYVTLEDIAISERYKSCLVRAAVFFSKAETSRSGIVMPRWRLRVRAQGCVCDWSAPTTWQLPPQPPVPPQPSTPKIVTHAEQHYMLEWTIPHGGYATEWGGSYELQMQSFQQRRGGKLTDWRCVPVYTTPVEEDSHSILIRALVERRAAVEVSRGNVAEDTVRFRVRITCDSGVTGEASDPSEYAPLQAPYPLVPPPASLEVVGHGRILMQSAAGSVLDAECVRLQWPLPTAEEDAEVANDASLANITYELEAKDEDHGLWVPMPGALIEIDRKTGTASSLIPLPSTGGDLPHTQFRVAAARCKGGEQSFSMPSPKISWGGAIEPEGPPKIVHAAPAVIVFRFTLPQYIARPGICSVSAALLIRRRKGRKHHSTALHRDSIAEESAEDGCSEGNDLDDLARMLGQVLDPNNQPDQQMKRRLSDDDHMYDVDDYDDEDDHDLKDFELMGEAPICWRSTMKSTSSNAGDATGTGLAYMDTTGAECEASLVLQHVSDRAQCAPGDHVKVAIRVVAVGLDMGELSDFSTSVVVAECERTLSADLHLEYPRWHAWHSLKANGKPETFIPHLFAGIYAGPDSQELTWCREAIRAKDGAQRLHFEVVRGLLPSGLRLDAETGNIWGRASYTTNQQSFTIRARVLVTWPGRVGAAVVAGSAASATLGCSFVDENSHDTLTGAFQDSVVNFLQEEEEKQADKATLEQLFKFLTSPQILTMNRSLQLVMEGETGSFVVDLIFRLLRWPSDALVVAAALDEEEFLSRLFGEDHEEYEESDSSSASTGANTPSNDAQEEEEAGDTATDLARSSICERADRRRSSILSFQNAFQELVSAGLAATQEDSEADGDTKKAQTRAKFAHGLSDDGSPDDKSKINLKRRHSVAGASQTSRSALSRRTSLAIQANNIKLDKIAELAKSIGLHSNATDDSDDSDSSKSSDDAGKDLNASLARSCKSRPGSKDGTHDSSDLARLVQKRKSRAGSPKESKSRAQSRACSPEAGAQGHGKSGLKAKSRPASPATAEKVKTRPGTPTGSDHGHEPCEIGDFFKTLKTRRASMASRRGSLAKRRGSWRGQTNCEVDSDLLRSEAGHLAFQAYDVADAHVGNDWVDSSKALFRYGVPAARRVPPLHVGGELLEGKIHSKPSPQIWKAQFNHNRPPLRTTVFPLGPPLRNRDPLDRLALASLKQPLSERSTRPLLCDLYEASDHNLPAHRPNSQGISRYRSHFKAMQSCRAETEVRASTAPHRNLCGPLGDTASQAAHGLHDQFSCGPIIHN